MEKDLTRIKYELQDLVNKYIIEDIYIEIEEDDLHNKKHVNLIIKM